MLSIAGGMLLLVAILGHLSVVNTYQSAPPREWEQFDPQLKTSTRTMADLILEARRELPADAHEREILNAMYWAVISRFTHREATHTFFGNWILFLFGRLDPVFAHIWDPGLMIARGHSLFCDQSSYLLLIMALSQGIEVRHVGLDGHVVMEAWYDSEWHMYDPDLEVVPVDAYGRILSVEQLASNAELLDKYYGAHGVASIVSTRQNNTYVSYPPGARFEWKANLLALFEKWMEVAKFAFPMVLMGAGLLMATRRTRL